MLCYKPFFKIEISDYHCRFFDDNLPAPAQAHVKICSDISASGLNKVKEEESGAELLPQEQALTPSLQMMSTMRRFSLLQHTKWQDNQMSTNQVTTITVAQSIRQVDKHGKVMEKLPPTFEVLKPEG
ncbi:brain and acute leukemia cytoplasmic protein-like [Arapaima gigas]